MNAQVNARRNDPCPCGSGLKFKNCHGDLRSGTPGDLRSGTPGDVSSSAAPSAPQSRLARPADEVDHALQQAMRRHQAGDIAGAQAEYRSILVRAPDSPIAMHFLGVALWQANQAAQALPLIEKSLALEGAIGDFHNNHALVLKSLGRRDEAIAACRRALALEAGNASAMNTLGMLLVESGAPADAVACFEDLLRIHSGFVEARVNLAQAQYQCGKHEQALAQAGIVLQSQPGQVEALLCKAQAHHKLSQYSEAFDTFNRILAQRPTDPRTLNAKAVALFDQGRTDEAEAAVNLALTTDPNYAPALLTLGNVFRRRGDVRAALQRYEQAEASAMASEGQTGKALADARTNVGIVSLALGDWARAWPAYTWKQHRNPGDRDANLPGLPPPFGDLKGQTIVVRGEQGLGDALFFLRFCPALKARGATVIYRGDARLAALLGGSTLFSARIPDDADGPSGSREVWVGDLPYLLGVALPANYPPLPLAARPDRLAAVAARLQSLGPAPYLALTWRAGTQTLVDNNPTLFKSIELGDLAKGLSRPNGTLISVQRHPKAGETEAFSQLLGRPVHDWSGVNDDLEEMLAVMSLVDEYVAVSNTNVHLRASAGKGATVLVPHPAEWRWMAEGDASPWFPGVKVLRQQRDGSWQAALSAL
jgi:Flp pilus assembly protein TadD